MRKILSIVLCLAMVLSLSVTAFAAENPTTASTPVEYEGLAEEVYTLTVPEELSPNGSGNVVLKGTWATNRVVTVSAPTSVTLTNDKDGGTKNLAVTFEGIEKTGDNTSEKTYTETISVANIENALFGTWSGTITYTVGIADNTPHFTDNTPHFTVDGKTYYFDEDMQWIDWLLSDYNTDKFCIVDYKNNNTIWYLCTICSSISKDDDYINDSIGPFGPFDTTEFTVFAEMPAYFEGAEKIVSGSTYTSYTLEN